jgi:hypothetical protein
MAMAVTLVLSIASVASAADQPVIREFSAGVTSLQAGGHPDAYVSFRLATETAPGIAVTIPGMTGDAQIPVGGTAKSVTVDLPKGLVGNPNGIPRCTVPQLTDVVCPIASQVGFATVHTILGGVPDSALVSPFGAGISPSNVGIYNVEPQKGELARFGFRVANSANAFVSVKLRDGDYGLTTIVSNIWNGIPMWGTDLTIWGVPGDPLHDPQRFCGSQTLGCSAGVPPRPFMTAPAECGVPGNATIRVNTWQHPENFAVAQSTPQLLDGCDRQLFKPTFNIWTDSTERGQPTGLNVEIGVPQTYDNPNGLATPPLRSARVTLPEGVAISASSWDGLDACSDEQLGVGNQEPVRCPNASRIGDVSLETPLLPEELTGGVFLGTQLSDDPQSGDLFRIAIQIANEERGLNIKIPGRIRVDPRTGQITAAFDENPQLAFSRLTLHFKGGQNAPLALPQRCGAATTSAELTGWGMTTSTRVSQTFQVTHDGDGAPCPLGFSPSFSAGTTKAVGGAFSPFTMSFGRDDADQDLSSLSITFPQGVLARIADVSALCPNAQANAGTCGEDSRIGSLTAATGPGPNPPAVPGRLYITEPYGGGAFGLSIVVPAVVGPFNLGTVVVRAAIIVDKNSAVLSVKSDPMPLILKGVPLRVRNITIDVDRPNFMFNPTNCSPMRFNGKITSETGATAGVGSRFQVGDCRALPFNPRMTLRVGKKGRTRPGITVPLSATVRMTPGQANLRTVRVNLPDNINARLAVINRNACPLEDYEAGRCTNLAIGNATAVTPLLKDPLRGNAYFVRNPARRIPDLVVALKGQVDVDLTGKVTIPPDLTLATTFDTVPDVPITSFTLNLVAGRSGPIGTIGNLCSARVRRGMKAKLAFKAQSGKSMARSQRMQIVGCAKTLRPRRTSKRNSRRGSARSK